MPFPFSIPSHLPLLIFIFHCFSLSPSLLLSPPASTILLLLHFFNLHSLTSPLFSFYSYLLLIFIPSSSSPPILSSSPLLSSSTVCHSPYPSLFSFPYLLTILLRSLSSLLIIFFSFFLFLSSLSALPFPLPFSATPAPSFFFLLRWYYALFFLSFSLLRYEEEVWGDMNERQNWREG